MDTLTGVLERITYHNEENGYTVARLTAERGGGLVTIVGNMMGINVGEAVELRGVWANHPKYGQQFKVEDFKTVYPATVAGIEKYLGSGMIKGVGPVTAKRIVRRFGADTLRVIDEDPDRLSRGAGGGQETGGDDQNGLGGAAPDQGSDDLPAIAWRLHQSGR